MSTGGIARWEADAGQVLLGGSRTTLDHRVDRGFGQRFEIAGKSCPIGGIARGDAGFEQERQ